jgi:hypothetical protein
VKGEIFVSGDYESATDNLKLDLQKLILGELLALSSQVPVGIMEHAMNTYDTILEYRGASVQLARGQLMGNLTSFPLLCLVNYIMFRYSIRRPVPVRINGDDIVFRATPDEITRWEHNVERGGLKLSLGKTIKNPKFFTLNSTPFESTPKGGRIIGFVRPRACWSDKPLSERILSLRSRFYAWSLGFGDEKKRLVRRFFLQECKEEVNASRRSLTRGMGLDVDQGMLRASGLWHRELYYLEQVIERPLPTLVSGGIPEGFVRSSSYWLPKEVVSRERSKFFERLISMAWNDPYDIRTIDEGFILNEIRNGCAPYGLQHLINKRVSRMLRLSISKSWKWIYQRSNPSVFGRVAFSRGGSVWVSEDVLNEYRFT